VGLFDLPSFSSSRGGIVSADTPGAAAAMAGDRQSERARFLLGQEEDIDDNVFPRVL